MPSTIFRISLVASIVFLLNLGSAFAMRTTPLQPDPSLFQEGSGMSGGNVPANAPDQYQTPHSRQAHNQVPEKLRFVFEGHSYGMQKLGNHFVSDVQTLLRQIETVNVTAWETFYNQAGEEYVSASSPGTPATLASAPAGALAIVAMDNAGVVGRQNVQFGVPFLFEGLGNQLGNGCNGTVEGMLMGNCEWGTPPVIESAIFSNIIGDDVNLNQLGGDYEVWGVSPARSTLINLIFNKGLLH